MTPGTQRSTVVFRLSADGIQVITSLREALGIGKTAVVELAVRELAQKKSRELARVKRARMVPLGARSRSEG